MRKAFAFLLVICLLTTIAHAETKRTYISSLTEFMERFNAAAQTLETEHKLSISSAFEISDRRDGTTLFKTIYNNCEVLSLILENVTDDIVEIHCTLTFGATNTPEYILDFSSLVSETLVACGIKPDIGIFEDLNIKESIAKNEHRFTVVNGIKISYYVNTTGGFTFSFEME